MKAFSENMRTTSHERTDAQSSLGTDSAPLQRKKTKKTGTYHRSGFLKRALVMLLAVTVLATSVPFTSFAEATDKAPAESSIGTVAPVENEATGTASAGAPSEEPEQTVETASPSEEPAKLTNTSEQPKQTVKTATPSEFPKQLRTLVEELPTEATISELTDRDEIIYSLDVIALIRKVVDLLTGSSMTDDTDDTDDAEGMEDGEVFYDLYTIPETDTEEESKTAVSAKRATVPEATYYIAENNLRTLSEEAKKDYEENIAPELDDKEDLLKGRLEELEIPEKLEELIALMRSLPAKEEIEKMSDAGKIIGLKEDIYTIIISREKLTEKEREYFDSHYKDDAEAAADEYLSELLDALRERFLEVSPLPEELTVRIWDVAADAQISELTDRSEIWQVKGDISFIKAYEYIYSSEKNLNTKKKNEGTTPTEEELANILTAEQIAYYKENILPVLNEKAGLLDALLRVNGDYELLSDVIKNVLSEDDYNNSSDAFKALVSEINALPLTEEETNHIHLDGSGAGNSEITPLITLVATTIPNMAAALSEDEQAVYNAAFGASAESPLMGPSGSLRSLYMARRTAIKGEALKIKRSLKVHLFDSDGNEITDVSTTGWYYCPPDTSNASPVSLSTAPLEVNFYVDSFGNAMYWEIGSGDQKIMQNEKETSYRFYISEGFYPIVDIEGFNTYSDAKKGSWTDRMDLWGLSNGSDIAVKLDYQIAPPILKLNIVGNNGAQFPDGAISGVYDTLVDSSDILIPKMDNATHSTVSGVDIAIWYGSATKIDFFWRNDKCVMRTAAAGGYVGAIGFFTTSVSSLSNANIDTYGIKILGYAFNDGTACPTSFSSPPKSGYVTIPDANALWIKIDKPAPIPYTLAFSTNGGTGTVPSKSVNTVDSVTMPTYSGTKTGYTFQGWSTSNTATTAAYSAGSSYSNLNLTSTAGSTVTLYAVWKPDSYNITYKDQGNTAFSGSHASGYPTSHTYGTATTLKSASKTGYTFDGWFTSSACTGTAVTSLGSTSYTSNITLYAKWTANSYSITYKDQGDTTFSGSHDSGYPTTHTYGTATTLKSASKTGYTFDGWYNASSGGTKVTSLAATSYTAAITLYAKWTANTYKISYVLDGGSFGSGTNHPANATYDATAFNLSAPTKTGYTFNGWNITGMGASGVYHYYGTTSSSLSSTTNGSLSGTKATYFKNLQSTKDAEVKFTATWTANTYSITLNGNGATSTGSSTAYVKYDTKNYYSNSGLSTALTLPTRTGYTFNGYWSNSSGGTKYIDANGTGNTNWTTANSTSTLYAQWTANTYKISYDLDGGTHGTNHPDTATYDAAAFNLSAPTKAGYHFNGWNITGMDASGVTHYYGDSTSSLTSVTGSSLSGTKATYFKNLQSTKDAVVKFTATWLKDVTKPTQADITYDGSSHFPVIDLPEGVTISETTSAQTNAGNYTTVYKLRSGYCWQDGTTADYTLIWKIVKDANPMKVKAAEKHQYYSNAAGIVDLTTVEGAYDMTSEQGNSLTYAIKSQTNPDSSDHVNHFGISGLNLTVGGGTPANTSPYTIIIQVTAEETANYNASAALEYTLSFYVDKGVPEVTEPTVNTVTYDGTSKQLASGGSSTGTGDFEYAIGNSDTDAPTGGWSTAAPTATDAGDYFIWYRVVENDMWYGDGPNYAGKAVINKATIYVSTQNGTDTYHNAETDGGATLGVTSPESGYTIKFGTEEGTYELDAIPKFTDAGTHTVYYKVTAGNNYNDKTGSFTITISPRSINEVSIAALPDNNNYEGTHANPAPAITDFDGGKTLVKDTDYTYEYTNVTPSTEASDEYSAVQTLTITAKGNYTGTRTLTYTEKRKAYTITYDGNGHGTSVDNIPSAGTKYYGIEYTVTSNYPNMTGATFKGWAYDDAAVESNKITTIGAMEHNADTTLYAIWSFGVTLHANDGEIINNLTSYTYSPDKTMLPKSDNDGIKTADDDVYRVGYDFDGWFDNPDLDGEPFDGIPARSSGAKEYWAKWSPRTDIKYTVKHIKQNMDCNTYPNAGSYTSSGTYADGLITVEVIEGGTADENRLINAKVYDGFRSPANQTVLIKPDGTTVVEFKYQRRNDYLAEFGIHEDSKGYGTVNTNTYAMIPNIPYESEITISDRVVTINGFDVEAIPSLADSQYKYSFDKWVDYDGNELPDKITDSIGISAVFKREVQKYDVKYYGADGTDANAQTLNLPYGTEITQAFKDASQGASPQVSIPEKPEDHKAVYTFNHKWSKTEGAITPEEVLVTGEGLKVYPVFDEDIKEYDVIFSANPDEGESNARFNLTDEEENPIDLPDGWSVEEYEGDGSDHTKAVKLKVKVPYGSKLPAGMFYPEKDDDSWSYDFVGWKTTPAAGEGGTWDDIPEVGESGFTGDTWNTPTYYAAYQQSIFVQKYSLEIKLDETTKDYGSISSFTLNEINPGSALSFSNETVKAKDTVTDFVTSSTLSLKNSKKNIVMNATATAIPEDDHYIYAFDYWKLQKKKEGVSDGDPWIMAQGSVFSMDTDIEATAYFKRVSQKYQLEFHKNCDEAVSYKDPLTGDPIAESALPSTYTCNTATALPVGVRDGYRFLGWTLTDSETDTDYITELTADDYGNKTLYARWNHVDRYKFRLNSESNYGEDIFGVALIDMTPVSADGYVDEGTEYTFKAQMKTANDAYEFAGWYVNGIELTEGTDYENTETLSILKFTFDDKHAKFDEHGENPYYNIVARYKYTFEEADGIKLTVTGEEEFEVYAKDGTGEELVGTGELNASTGKYEYSGSIIPYKTVTLHYTGSNVPEWVDEGNSVVSSSNDYTFKIVVQREYRLKTVKKGLPASSYFVEARSDFGKIIKSETIESIDALKAMLQEVEDDGLIPTRLGKRFTGEWVLTSGMKLSNIRKLSQLASYAEKDAGNRIIFYPEYVQQTDQTATITLITVLEGKDTHREEHFQYAIGTNATLTAKNYNGLYFKCWANDAEGKDVLGSSTNYPVHVGADRTIYAVYSYEKNTNVFPTIKVTQVITGVSEKGSPAMIFQATRDIPDGIELLGHGIMYRAVPFESGTSDADIEKSVKFAESPDTGNVAPLPDVTVSYGKQLGKHTGYDVTIPVGAYTANPLYIRGYIIVSDGSKQWIVYTDLYQISYQGIDDYNAQGEQKRVSPTYYYIIPTSTPDPEPEEHGEEDNPFG